MYIYRRNFPAPHNSRRVRLLSLSPALAPPHLGPGPATAEARLGHRVVDPVKVMSHILVHAKHFLIILKLSFCNAQGGDVVSAYSLLAAVRPTEDPDQDVLSSVRLVGQRSSTIHLKTHW